MVRMQRFENWFQSGLSDCCLALRQFHKSPAFATAAVLTLTLGIGANTAIFSLIDAALLRSLPVRDAQQLVVFQWAAHNSPNTKGHYSYMSCPTNAGAGASPTDWAAEASGEHGCSFSFPMFRQFRALQDAFSSVVALGGDVGLNLRGNGSASFVHGEMVSGEF